MDAVDSTLGTLYPAFYLIFYLTLYLLFPCFRLVSSPALSIFFW